MNSKWKLILAGTVLLAAIGLGMFIVGCSRQPTSADTTAASSEKTLYTCGMHPWIIQDHPGNCPICGMKLEPIHKTASTATAGGHKILYYKSTMKPGETSPVPAKDSMGMDMVPVYESEGNASSAIAVDPATIQMMNIQTTTVERGPLRRTIRTVGTIDYNETALADVTTKFKGWIEKLDVDATGQLVHRGAPLFEIYSPELYSAEAEYLATLNSANDAGASPLREAALDKLKFFDISDAQIAELDKNRTAKKTLEILAPADGFVIEKDVVPGQMVDAGMKLYRLADLGIVWVFAQVYEQDLPYVQLGQEATVKLSSLPDREFRGRVTYVYPNVDEKTRTARVRLEFENPGYFLKPGMFVSVQITSELEPSVLLVPDSAVLRSGEQNTVFVALRGGKFDPRTVALGPEAERDMVEVISGLQEGERVVASGQFMLDSESQLREAIQKMSGSAGEAAASAPITNTNQQEQVSATNAAREGVVYVCPMPEHISIVYDHPGKCPICGMTLVPVTPNELKQLQPGGKVLYYTCPMPEHNYIHEDKPGKCPVCGMTLIPVMASPDSATNSLPDAIQPSTNPSTPNPVPHPAPSITNSPPVSQPAVKQLYTCPMHPDVISDKPGKCPKCGMNLVPVVDTAN
ncbi:MAG TPA: efflux RND transporter periplasmic adaptor subunit [Candidatus Limnocylindrales bacterium]|nr:efflux RND transporter periplasmic adaptor subunit [Candidatus Limnocylindrales bacterium]